LYNILIVFGIPRKPVGLIKICSNKTCSMVRVDKNLSDKFPIHSGLNQGDTLSPLFFNSLEYAFRRVQVNQEGLKLNGTHWILVCAGDFNVVRENIGTIQNNTKALLDANKEVCL
jgi:hypothetical protein